MSETSYKIKHTILLILGIFSLVSIVYQFMYYKRILCSFYLSRVIFKAEVIAGIRSRTIVFFSVQAAIIVLLAILLICIINIFEANIRLKYWRYSNRAYKFLGIYCALAALYTLVGFIIIPSNHKGGDLSVILTIVGFVGLLVYSILKCCRTRKEGFDFVNLILIAMMIILFLTGGILLPSAKTSYAILNGAMIVMPLIYILYFELVCMPALNKSTKETSTS